MCTVELMNHFRYLESSQLEEVLAVHQGILILMVVCCVHTLLLHLQIKAENVASKVLLI